MIGQSSRNGIFDASSKAARLRGKSAQVTMARKMPKKTGPGSRRN
jgi:hypothetical protein